MADKPQFSHDHIRRPTKVGLIGQKLCVTVIDRQQKPTILEVWGYSHQKGLSARFLATSEGGQRGTTMSYTGINTKGPNDQKTLNEELIEGLVEIARRNPQHAADLFGVSFGVAARLAAMSDAQLEDLATTPVALWRPALTERLVRRLPERRPMAMPAHDIYRPIVERINRLALAMFVRYADDPANAALVCALSDAAVIRALQELPAFAFLEWGGNPGVPLVVPCIGDGMLDRLLRLDDDGTAVEPGLRALFGFAYAQEEAFQQLREAVRREVDPAAVARVEVVKRAGRPPANFLMPTTSMLILTMLRHQMRPTEVEEWLLAVTDVRAAQLRGIAEALNPKPKRDKNAPRDRRRDHRDLWGSAHRRLTATAVFRLHRRLVDAGVEAFEAMVRAYDYYVVTYDPECGVSLSRMLKDVFSPMREGTSTHLSHCPKCDVVHLTHEERTCIIECPACVLARAGRYGSRRDRAEKAPPQPSRVRAFGAAWPGSGASWPMTLGGVLSRVG